MFGSEIGHNVAALEMYKMVLWRVERSAGDAAREVWEVDEVP